jgi:hypothetical protein
LDKDAAAAAGGVSEQTAAADGHLAPPPR